MGALIEGLVRNVNAEYADRRLFETDLTKYHELRRTERQAREDRIEQVRNAFWMYIGDRAVIGKHRFPFSAGHQAQYEPVRLSVIEKTEPPRALWALPYVTHSEERKRITWPIRDARGAIIGHSESSESGDVVVKDYGFAIVEGLYDEVPTQRGGHFRTRYSMDAAPDLNDAQMFRRVNELGLFLDELVALDLQVAAAAPEATV